jgi:hypothetical protein
MNVPVSRRSVLRALAATPLVLAAGAACSGPAPLPPPVRPAKSNPMPVYAHYMPWFQTPRTLGGTSWGVHWTLDRQDPNVVTAGRRQIASHYYPAIGPYDSTDPAVLEYHLLLMKLSGIDGVLVDWYGVAGGNPDLDANRRGADAVIDAAGALGLDFALVLEDRFARTVSDARDNVAYAASSYFARPNHVQVGGRPLMGVFGPISFRMQAEWRLITQAAPTPPALLTLWHNDGAGDVAAGRFAWPYASAGTDDHLAMLEAFYRDAAPTLGTAMGVAYPGFDDFYAESGREPSPFHIPARDGVTLDELLTLATRYRPNLDLLQLATWNDFGEGTMIEPTVETGYSALTRVQRFTGVPYAQADLELVRRLYDARVRHAGDAQAARTLDAAAADIAALRLPDAAGRLGDLP